MGKFYMLLMYAWLSIGMALGQQVITGTVSSAENGEPLANVSVVVAGTDVSVQSDDRGNYRITPPAGDGELIFSMVGYQTLRQPIDEQTSIDVRMVSTVQDLDEVVVVGYGTQKKINLTGSVESVDGERLAVRPVISASMALQGAVSGVTVTQSSGRPGADGGVIRIRGIGTLGDSNPLILVDGRPSGLDGLDPNDIENISVLKDASSAAIYGSRAANGVILITTKRGSAQGIKVDYRAYFGVQQFTDLPEYVDGYTHLIKNNEAVQNSGRSPLYTDDFISNYQSQSGLYSYEYPNVDWQDLMFTGSGAQHHHNLSLSGGGEQFRSRVSLSYMDQKGMVPNFAIQRYSLRTNNDIKTTKWLDFKVDFYGRISPMSDPAMGVNQVFDLQRYGPLMAAYLPDGRYATNNLNYPNLKAMVEQGGTNLNDYLSLSGRIMASIKPVDGLTIDLSYMPEYGQGRGKRFAKPVGLYRPDSDEPALYQPSLSVLNESFNRNFTNNFNIVSRYGLSKGKHDVTLLAGYEQIDYRTNSFGAYRENFSFLDYPVLDAGSVINMRNNGTGSEWALQSVFGRINYDYNDKYLVEANLRYDGSSRFAESGRFGYFPSFSVGWNLHRELFLVDIDAINLLKIRGSWGMLGNQNIGTYPYLSVVDLGINYVLNGEPANGLALTEMANELINWESTTTVNIGVDVGLWGDRVVGSFDWYNRLTDGILLKLPIPSVIGLDAPYQNAGKVQNRGWDVNLTYRNNDNDFKYSVRGVLSDVRNKVVSLSGGGPFISRFSIVKEGHPIDALYMLQSDGLFQSTEEISNHVAQFGSLAPGDIRYVNQLTVDSDGDGTEDNWDDLINADDRVVVGDAIPRLTYGLDFNAEYKGFDFSLVLQGVGKRDTYLDGSNAFAFYNVGQMQTWHLDYWTPDNPNAKYPRLIDGSSHNNFEVSDYWKYNGAYLRVKLLNLGYTLPSRVSGSLGLSSVRVYLAANNLLTFDHLPKGYDPEYPLGNAFSYPITASYVVGVNVSF